MIVMFDLLKIIMIINSNSHYSNSNDAMCWGWSMPSYHLVTHSEHLSFFFVHVWWLASSNGAIRPPC